MATNTNWQTSLRAVSEALLIVVVTVSFPAIALPEVLGEDESAAISSNTVAEKTVVRTYSIPNGGKFQMQIPISWRESVTTYEHPLFYTLTFFPQTGAEVKVSVNVHAPSPRTRGPQTEMSRQKLMEEFFRQTLLPYCEEKNLTSRKISGAAGAGYYFSLTDKRIKAGERIRGQYRHLTYGTYLLNGDLLDFMIEAHDEEAQVLNQVIEMLKSAQKVSN